MGSCKVKTKTQLQMIAIPPRQIHKANFVSKLVYSGYAKRENGPPQYHEGKIGPNEHRNGPTATTTKASNK